MMRRQFFKKLPTVLRNDDLKRHAKKRADSADFSRYYRPQFPILAGSEPTKTKGLKLMLVRNKWATNRYIF
jgi:hypothetical protein